MIEYDAEGRVTRLYPPLRGRRPKNVPPDTLLGRFLFGASIKEIAKERGMSESEVEAELREGWGR